MVSLDSLRDYQKLLFDNFNSTSVQGLFALTTSVENGLIDQPKPQYSYIGLIAMAILSSPDRKMILSEVYDWIVHHYPYFRSRGSGWRNSIRHNLSLNDCFVKAGRAANGKGHYWAIHPANLRDFERGDFRRRRAQRKVRRHMGLSVPDGESSDESPSTSPRPPLNEQQNVNNLFSLSNPLFNLSHFRFPFLINETFQQNIDAERNKKKPMNRGNFTIDSILGGAI